VCVSLRGVELALGNGNGRAGRKGRLCCGARGGGAQGCGPFVLCTTQVSAAAVRAVHRRVHRAADPQPVRSSEFAPSSSPSSFTTWLPLQAVWLLKIRALTEQAYIDDTDLEEEGLGDAMMDDHAMAQAPRPGTSVSKTTGRVPSGMDPSIRPVTASGRPMSGFLRPSTASGGSARGTTGSGRITSGFAAGRLGSSRPLTALGRRVRLGTASMLSHKGGPFIDVARLDFRKYARRPELAKALCDYLLYHDVNPRKAAELAAQATVVMGYTDWFWKSRLGKCYYQLGMIRDAEQQFRSAIGHQPVLECFLELGKVYLRLDQPASALDAYVRGTEACPGDTSLMLAVARTQELLANTDLALSAFKRVLHYDASSPEAIASMAAHHFYSDQPEVALKHYRRLLQMGLFTAELWNNLGLACFYAGQYDMTLTCFERALSVAGVDCTADVWYNVAQVAVGLGDTALAYQALKVALSADPSHAESMVNLGVIELRRNRAEVARSLFDSAQRFGPHLFEGWFNGALLAYKMGNFQDAFQQCARGLDVYPDHADSKDLMTRLKKMFTLA
jgi:tetratricopeptide repeat protein 8